MKHPYIQQVYNACRENSIYAVPNFYIGEYGNAYDMSLLIDGQGEIIGKQKMVHIAQCPQFYRKHCTTAGLMGWNKIRNIISKKTANSSSFSNTQTGVWNTLNIKSSRRLVHYAARITC